MGEVTYLDGHVDVVVRAIQGCAHLQLRQLGSIWTHEHCRGTTASGRALPRAMNTRCTLTSNVVRDVKEAQDLVALDNGHGENLGLGHACEDGRQQLLRSRLDHRVALVQHATDELCPGARTSDGVRTTSKTPPSNRRHLEPCGRSTQ